MEFEIVANLTKMIIDRITKKFEELRRVHKSAFMPFIVGGDPNFNTSLKIAKTLCENADLLEIGFPYSDPLADGPTIQAADARALHSGATTDSVFRLIIYIRKFSQIPITVLVYANLVLQRGIDKFYSDANKCGVDAVLIPDVPLEEIDPFVHAAAKYNINPIFLVTQMTDNERLNKILKYSKGFLYLVSILGVTGARKAFPKETGEFIRRIRLQTKMPLCVGFGISTPAQFKEMIQAGADGAIVASAIVDVIAKNLGKRGILKKLEQFTAGFKK